MHRPKGSTIFFNTPAAMASVIITLAPWQQGTPTDASPPRELLRMDCP